MPDKLKLTKTTVDRLPFSEKGKQVDYYDIELPSFGIRVSATSKTYFIRKWINGKLSRVTIGRNNVISADAARKMAADVSTEIRKGVDVNKEKAIGKLRGMTLSDAFKDFLEARQSLKSSTLEYYTYVIEKLFADWATTPIAEITKDMIARRHKTLSTNSGPAAANGAMRTFRTVYNFARTLTDNAIPENPVQRLSQTRQWCKIERRKTFIRPHELKSWYESVQMIDNAVIRDFLLLTVFTGIRKTEGLTLKWASVDLRDKSFTITDTKNGLPHTLPVSTYLYGLFQQLQKFRTNEYVFPGTGKAGHLVETRKQIAIVEKQSRFIMNEVLNQAELDIKNELNPDSVLNGVSFTLHDLRRTFITVAESLDIPYAALKKLLNHSDGNDVTGGYLQITTDRLRVPMERISSKLMELMGIPIPVSAESEEESVLNNN